MHIARKIQWIVSLRSSQKTTPVNIEGIGALTPFELTPQYVI
jgi:hypothetical protein